MHAERRIEQRTVECDEIGTICDYANQFNLPKIIDHFSTVEVQDSSYEDPEQQVKRYMNRGHFGSLFSLSGEDSFLTSYGLSS
jgi:hypothetical protein